jgi:AraC-like DNA-binding protein
VLAALLDMDGAAPVAPKDELIPRGDNPARPWHQRWDVRLMFFSVVILPLVVFLAYRFDSPLPFTIPTLIFFTGLSSTAYAALFGTKRLGSAGAKMVLPPPNADAYLELLMARLNGELAQRDALSPMVIEGLMLEMIAATSRTVAPPIESEAPAWLFQVDGFLRAKFASPLTLAEVAEVGGVHTTHLARAFRRHFGCTVGERIRQLRVGESRRLLVETQSPLAEIALVSGFYDQSHFSRCFRQLCGVTPSEFRAANHTR